MREPRNEQIRKAIEYLRNNPSCKHEFLFFLAWIRCELVRCDKANRHRGNDQGTEAEALAKILDVCGGESVIAKETENIAANE